MYKRQGSNLPAGVCEDLSFGVTFLESRSLPGGKELLYSLKCERHPSVSPQKNGVSLIFSNSRAIFEGLSAIDLLVSEASETSRSIALRPSKIARELLKIRLTPFF